MICHVRQATNSLKTDIKPAQRLIINRDKTISRAIDALESDRWLGETRYTSCHSENRLRLYRSPLSFDRPCPPNCDSVESRVTSLLVFAHSAFIRAPRKRGLRFGTSARTTVACARYFYCAQSTFGLGALDVKRCLRSARPCAHGSRSFARKSTCARRVHGTSGDIDPSLTCNR